MPNKNKGYLTSHEVDQISRYLGLKGWNKFVKMSGDKRVKFGLQILRKINKGNEDENNKKNNSQKKITRSSR